MSLLDIDEAVAVKYPIWLVSRDHLTRTWVQVDWVTWCHIMIASLAARPVTPIVPTPQSDVLAALCDNVHPDMVLA